MNNGATTNISVCLNNFSWTAAIPIISKFSKRGAISNIKKTSIPNEIDSFSSGTSSRLQKNRINPTYIALNTMTPTKTSMNPCRFRCEALMRWMKFMMFVVWREWPGAARKSIPKCPVHRERCLPRGSCRGAANATRQMPQLAATPMPLEFCRGAHCFG